MPHEPRLKGLAERREARLRERRQGKSGLLELWKVPKGEKREVHRARVFFATLPPDDLLAAYAAVTKALEQRKNDTP
jgi:hypothetical protein